MNTPVSFEIAKLLEEKEFDESTEANWWILAKDHSENYNKKLPVDESKIFFTENSYELEMATQIDEDTEHNVYHVLSAPTIAEVVMWLYEKHEIWVQVSISRYGKLYCNILKKENTKSLDNPISWEMQCQLNDFNSPIEAYEKGIEHILNEMI